MASVSRSRIMTVAAVTATAALALSGCAGGGAGGDSADDALDGIIVGTTVPITSLDPAGSYDSGSFAVQIQVFPFLFDSPYGSPDVEPSIAESGEFTSPTEYTVKLKDGLTFANGNDLTSSDVKFSFDRIKDIADENGPSSLLGNIDSIDAPDDTTVVFNLVAGDDQTLEQVLSSPAGPIVDEDVFSATEITDPDTIVKGNAFAGPYTITDYTQDQLVQYKANPDYQGLNGAAKTDSMTTRFFTTPTDMKLAVQQGDIDVAFSSLTPTDIDDLRGDDEVTVNDGPGGEIRYIVFNFDTMPYGAKTSAPDAAKSLAVRQAVADSIDRDEVSDQVFSGLYTPLYSYVPDGLTGATESLKDLYGDGDGGPDVDRATERLEAAGVTTPVELNIQYSPDKYGAASDDEYAAYKSQLEETGLFTVNIESTEYASYRTARVADEYPEYQLGWFPDYSDADNYLTPFFAPSADADGNLVPGGFLLNHYEDPTVTTLIKNQLVETDEATRTQMIEDIQDDVAAQLSTLPLLQGAGVAVTRSDIDGATDTLDPSFKFRYAALSRS